MVRCHQTTEAITKFALPELVLRSTEQITGLVYLVQGELEPGNRITVEALIVLDVHGNLYLRRLQPENLPTYVVVFAAKRHFFITKSCVSAE